MNKIKKIVLLLIPIFAVMFVLNGCKSNNFSNPETEPLVLNKLTKKEKIAATLVYGGDQMYSETWTQYYHIALKKKLRVTPFGDSEGYSFKKDLEYGLPTGGNVPNCSIDGNMVEFANENDVVETKSFKSIVKSLNKNSLQGKVRKVAKHLVVLDEYKHYKG